jgi:3-oxoacyl-[acyl-carrier protein] reductase
MSLPGSPISLPGLEGRRILVTGGSRGIGRAAVILLARAGARVGIAYRQAHEEAAAAVQEARGAAVARSPDGLEGLEGTAADFWAEAGDLSRASDVEKLFERVDREFGGLDGFVGNAGIWNAHDRPIQELDPEEWAEMMEVNLTSIFLTTRAAVQRMDRGGRIVLLSSTAAQRGEANHSHYAASKGAINSFCKSLAPELGPHDITVNAVAPGWVDTDMAAPALGAADLDAILGGIPLGRVAAAEDVAGPIVFLLSDLARHLTGEIVNVNGGSVLCG